MSCFYKGHEISGYSDIAASVNANLNLEITLKVRKTLTEFKYCLLFFPFFKVVYFNEHCLFSDIVNVK